MNCTEMIRTLDEVLGNLTRIEADGSLPLPTRSLLWQVLEALKAEEAREKQSKVVTNAVDFNKQIRDIANHVHTFGAPHPGLPQNPKAGDIGCDAHGVFHRAHQRVDSNRAEWVAEPTLEDRVTALEKRLTTITANEAEGAKAINRLFEQVDAIARAATERFLKSGGAQ